MKVKGFLKVSYTEMHQKVEVAIKLLKNITAKQISKTTKVYHIHCKWSACKEHQATPMQMYTPGSEASKYMRHFPQRNCDRTNIRNIQIHGYIEKFLYSLIISKCLWSHLYSTPIAPSIQRRNNIK